MSVKEKLQANYEDMVEIRRHLHMYPELSFKEVNTPKLVAEKLRSYGIEVKENVGGNGVVGYLEGTFDGPTIAFRADFDALPIQDEKEVPYKSKVDGVSHACGHDIHTAALLGLAKSLADNRDALHGNVVFIHQFAEEVVPGGAKAMVEAGCLNGVDYVYGSHVSSWSELGTVLFCEGYAMAAADFFELTIQGKGGHGASPHETIDPIVAAAQFVFGVQPIVSRNTDPIESAVITIGKIESGTVGNVIPDKAHLTGTVRTINPAIRDMVEQKLNNLCKAIEIQYGATLEFNYTRGYDAVYNHPTETAMLREAVSTNLPDLQVLNAPPRMGAEDFTYYLQEKPGTFFFTGGGNPEINAVYPHHHPRFDVDEQSMLNIANVFVEALKLHGVIK
ncbi:M20 metallopeptidase family protein [Solibacillus isronensis]|uniref:M20 metallopeptidase family protein n=1 Tax=Solibacillus isronensis TaxID=412383 RepID=UPI00203B60DA|nr:amidohydrolase [Solibacillus isronensis]MCM3723713.1 amidohydrolase [Solibacillus isronensis]